jgi:hypothetical protein
MEEEFEVNTYSGWSNKDPLPKTSIINILYPYGSKDFKANTKYYNTGIRQKINDNDIHSIQEAIKLGMIVTPDILYYAQKLVQQSPQNDTLYAIYKLLKNNYNAKRIKQSETLDEKCILNHNLIGQIIHHKYYINHLVFLPPNNLKPNMLNKLLTLKPQQVTNVIEWNTDEFGRSNEYFQPDIDKEWLKQMDNYLLSLPRTDLLMLWAYTKQDDMLLNTYLRYHQTNPEKVKKVLQQGCAADIPILFIPWKKMHNINYKSIEEDLKAYEEYYENETIDEMKELVEFCCKEIQRIILESPPTTKPMTVYRGLKSQWWKTKQKTLRVSEFLSSSLSVGAADAFADNFSVCCLKRIILPEKSHVLFLNGVSMKQTELEVLLPYNSEFLLLDENTAYSYTPKYVNPFHKEQGAYLCESVVNSRRIYTLQMIVDDEDQNENKKQIKRSQK